MGEWDTVVQNFKAHKNIVTACFVKNQEFICINISHDDHYNYYMDQTRIITKIIKVSKELSIRKTLEFSASKSQSSWAAIK